MPSNSTKSKPSTKSQRDHSRAFFRPTPILPPGLGTKPSDYESYLTSYRIYTQAIEASRQEFWLRRAEAPVKGVPAYEWSKTRKTEEVIVEHPAIPEKVTRGGVIKSYVYSIAFDDKGLPKSPAGLTWHSEPQFLDLTASQYCFTEGDRGDGSLLYKPNLQAQFSGLRVWTRARAVEQHQPDIVIPAKEAWTEKKFVATGEISFGTVPLMDGSKRLFFKPPKTQQPVRPKPPPPTEKEVQDKKSRRAAARRRQRAARRARDLGAKVALEKKRVDLVSVKVARLAKEHDLAKINRRSRRKNERRAARKLKSVVPSGEGLLPLAEAAPSASKAHNNGGRDDPPPPNRKARRLAKFGPPVVEQ